MRKIDKIIIHCTGTETGTLESVRRFHMEERGWKDIGYHYFIELDGTLRKGRSDWSVGAHCTGVNSTSIGVCMVGVKNFSDNQLKTLRELLIELMRKYSLGVESITGHYEWPSAKAQKKTCPNMTTKQLRDLVSDNE